MARRHDMYDATAAPPRDWTSAFTLADDLVISGMEPELRAVVERYARSGGASHPSDYEEGFEDGVAAMKDEVSWADPVPERGARRR